MSRLVTEMYVIYSVYFEGRLVLQLAHPSDSLFRLKINSHIDTLVEDFKDRATEGKLTFHLVADGVDTTECDIIRNIKTKQSAMINWRTPTPVEA